MKFTFKIDDDVELGLLEERHAEELFALTDHNREYLRGWLSWLDTTRNVEDTRKFIKHSLEQFIQQKDFSVAIWFQGKITGTIGYHDTDYINHKTHIGYWVGAEYQGKGLVTKACRALIDHAFNELGMNRVEILCAPENKRSRAIPERLGFTQEGILRQAGKLPDRYVDLVVYGILVSEWRKQTE